MTYAGYLVVGTVAEYLGMGRAMAGLLLGALFARFPWVVQGKLRVVGLLPGPARRPLMAGLLVLCALRFLVRDDYVPAGVTGFVAMFLVAFPWLRRTVFDRMRSSVFQFAGQRPASPDDGTVIDGEFREKKD